MIRFFPVAVIFIGWLTSCEAAKKGETASGNRGKDAEAIKKLERDWLTAEFRLDTAAIAPMMDDAFVSVNITGIANKQQELDGMYQHISQRIKENHLVDSLYLDEMRIKLYGNAAVVTFVTVTRGRIKDIPFQNRRTRFYDVWIKRKGKWKAVSSQGTPLP